MKKVLITLGSLIAVAACAVIIFFAISKNKVDLTDSMTWRTVTESEFTAKIPDVLEATDKLFHTSTGTEQIACYSYKDVVFSVARKSADSGYTKQHLEKQLNNIKINGEPINHKEIGDGFYYDSLDDGTYEIDGLFLGNGKIYSIVIECDGSNMNEYKDSMLKWLESFTIS